MNKNCYRIIFNKARGLLMAVAETCVSQGKASGETFALSKKGGRSLIAAINPLTFFVWVLFGMVMTPAAYAQIVADPSAAANQRPTILSAPNNLPLVNIQTPSAAGVSRNTYSQFDIQQQGAILNNSRTNIQTQLGGWVQGNPWLATGSARVILNEVNSNNPSLLRGYVEVAGQRAQVVIANPSGMTCDGCGFINANRVTVTTGTPIMNSGNLEGFRVQGGLVTITGNGMDTSATDYTDIIARAIQINAGIWAGQLKIVAGANQVSIDQATSDPKVSGTTTGAGAAPAFSIDTAQLGGMYAGKITLLATEAGIGVRNAGKMYAGVGDVVITANGQLRNAGQITSGGHAQIDTQNGIQNTGTVYAQGKTALSTRGNIDNNGVIAAQGNTALNATGTASQITSTSSSVLAAGVQTDGALGTSGDLMASATQSITAQGRNLSGGNQSLTAQTVGLSGSQTSARNLSVTASSGNINLANAAVAASQTLTANAKQTLRTDSANVSANQINANAHDVSNVQGQIVQTGSGEMLLNLPGNLDNTEGRIAGNSANINISANTLTNTAGTLEHAGTGILGLNANTFNGTRGTIASNGALNLTATNATLDTATTTASQVTINTSTLSHQGGNLIQTGRGAATITTSNQLDNTDGTIASGGNTTLTVGALKNQRGAIQAVGVMPSQLTVAATGRVDNSNAGAIMANGNITVTAASVHNSQGQITASQALSTSTTQTTDNTRGVIAANGQVSVSAAQVTNQNGTIGSVQEAVNVTAQAGTLNNTAGRIEAAKTVTVAGVGITNINGAITGKSLSANSQNQAFDNTHGKLIARGNGGADTLDVQSGVFTNDSGLVQGASSLDIKTHGQQLTNTNSGTSNGIVGRGSVRLSSGNLNNQAGYIGSNAALTITGTALTNTQGGSIMSNAGAMLNAESLNNQGGQIQAVGNLSTTATGNINNTGGLVRSGQSLNVTTADVTNAHTQGSNQGLEGNDVSLTASSIDNTTGAIRANNNTSLNSGGALDNTNGSISANNTLTVKDTATNKSLAVTNTGGTLLAGQQLTVDAASLNGDGQIASLGNLTIKFKQSFTNTQSLVVNGNAIVETDAALINQGTLAAGGVLNVKAATINNPAGGTISAHNIKLQATESHPLTNRGTINGTETVLESQTVNNLGTGKIYGDHVAIGATTLTNAVEDGTAPVIAARDRLDIGAETINNSGNAILFSGGDVAIGGTLDAGKRATGQATALNNSDGATIEATGAADINVKTINNTNPHFSTTTENLPAQNITEYQGAGSPNRYIPGTPGVAIFRNESIRLRTPEGDYKSWSAYNYTRSISETRVQSSNPAQILSGGAMRITADIVNNDKSRIIAGGTITGAIGALNNTEAPGERVTTDSGSVTSYWRKKRRGKDTTRSSSAVYQPAPTIQAISLTPTVYQENTATTGSGTPIDARSTITVNQTPGAASSATGTTQGGQTITPITQVVSASSIGATGPATVVRSGGINTSIPNSRLFGIAPNPTSNYLIETDPAFANYHTWLSSDYLLKALSLDPALTQKRLDDGFHEQNLVREQVAQLTGRHFQESHGNDEAQYQAMMNNGATAAQTYNLALNSALTQKRLGDGFYEQKLIREQVAQLTGRRFLDGHSNDEAQYQALMNNGITFAQTYKLVPGVSLSAAQMAQLTSDIVWLVEKDITLPNGTTTKALVPQLYVHVQEGDLQAGGALLSGNELNLSLSGDLTNRGTIAGRQVVAINADNVNNLGGRLLGHDISVSARTDLNNLGGTIAANNRLIANAGRDLNARSSTRTQTNAQGHQTHIDRVAGLYVTGSTGTLLASAGGDINLIAAAIQNQGRGESRITANNDLHLGTLTQSNRQQIVWDSKNRRSDASRGDIGSTIQTQGNLTLAAGNDLTAQAAHVTSHQGNLLATAGNKVQLTAGEANVQLDEAHQHKGRSSAFSRKTITTRDTLDQTTAQATTFSGNSTTVLAGQDLTLRGATLTATHNLDLWAGRDLLLTPATGYHHETHLQKSTKRLNGWVKGWLGSSLLTGSALSAAPFLLLNEQQHSRQQNDAAQTPFASRLSAETLNTHSGRDTHLQGSTLITDQLLTLTAARHLFIENATSRAQHQAQEKHRARGGIGSFWQPAVGRLQQTQTRHETQTQPTPSQIASLHGDIHLKAGADHHQRASQLLAPQGDIRIDAGRINLESAAAAQSQHQSARYKKTAIGGQVSVPLLNTLDSLRRTARAASQTDDPRLTALAAFTMALESQSALEGAQALAAGQSPGIKVSVSLGTRKQRSDSEQQQQSAVPSTLLAKKDLTLRAQGKAQDSDITAEGAQLTAGGDLTLIAEGDLLLHAAQNTSILHSANSGGGASIGIGFAFGGSQNGATLELGAHRQKGQAEGNEITWTNTHLTAADTLTLQSGQDTILKGAIAEGQKVTVQSGGKLELESLQDHRHDDGKQQSSGFGLSLCIPPFCYGMSSGSVSVAGSQINGDYRSVAEQTGIKAGDEGFDLHVADSTKLNGAVITSAQKALDADKNRFTTKTLSLADIENHAQYDAKGYSLFLSASTRLGDQSSKAAQARMSAADQAAAATQPGPTGAAGIGQKADRASSITYAGISGIAGHKEARTGDRESGLQPIFDREKVQKDIDAQVKITQEFGQRASKAWGQYANAKFTDALKTGDEAGLQCWGPDGACRAGGHALIGGIGGGAGGALGAGVSSLAAPHVNAFLMDQGIPPAAAAALTQLSALGAGKVVGGQTGAAGALNEASNNALPAAILFLPSLAESIVAGGSLAVISCVASPACMNALRLGGQALVDKVVSTLKPEEIAQIPGFNADNQPSQAGLLITPIPDPREMQRRYGTPPLENPDALRSWLANALEGYSATEAEKWAKDWITILPMAEQRHYGDLLLQAARDSASLRNGHLAGNAHPVTGIPFDLSGYPDFSAVSIVEVKINQTGSRAGDFRVANEVAGLKSTPEGYTWHHHQDGKTMQLVPRDIHARTGHTGGFKSNEQD